MESITPILEFKKTCVSYTKQTMAVKYVSAAIEKNTITAKGTPPLRLAIHRIFAHIVIKLFSVFLFLFLNVVQGVAKFRA